MRLRVQRWCLPGLAAAVMASAAGCQVDAPGGATADALPVPVADGGATGEAPPPAASVDFVATGCPRGLPARCEGPAPLAVTFTALVGGVRGALTWDFGDHSAAARGAVVTHTFATPGRYDVVLTAAAAGGTLSERKAGFVVVSAAVPGGRCDQDRSCGSGARCVCRASACGPSLAGGLCLVPCSGTACPSGSVCVDLRPPVGSPTTAPWRTRLCLPACTAAGACGRPGFTCRPAPVAGGGWRPACLPPLPGDVAAPCRTSAGALDPSRCLGRRCLDLGARGYCTAACSAGGCPEGSRCTRVAGITGEVCLRRCGPGKTGCGGDPLLRCEEPDARGRFGFSVTGPKDPSGTTYCAPRRCRAAADCGLGGRCDLAAGGFCRGR